MAGAPDPAVLDPVTGQERVVFLKALVTDPKIEVGEYTHYCSAPLGGTVPWSS